MPGSPRRRKADRGLVYTTPVLPRRPQVTRVPLPTTIDVPRRPQGDLPPFWLCFATVYLECDVALARQLWKALSPSQAVRFQLTLCDATCSPVQIQRLGEMLPPSALLAAAERLSPPDGRIRRAAVLRLEERILEKTSSTGLWV